MSDQQPTQQNDRAECRVGDWVLASTVPEWGTALVFQVFAPETLVAPAFYKDEKPVNVPPVRRWVFRGGLFTTAAGDAVRIWRRES